MDSFILLAASASEDLSSVSRIANEFGVNWKILIAQMVNFCVVAYLLYRFAFQPIIKTLDDRQKKISDGLKFSEEMEQQLRNTQQEKEATLAKAALEGKAIINEARDKARQHIEEQAQHAIAKSEDMIKKAEQAISLEKQQMFLELKKDVADLVLETTRKVLAKELSLDDKTRFTDAAAKELQSHVSELSLN